MNFGDTIQFVMKAFTLLMFSGKNYLKNWHRFFLKCLVELTIETIWTRISFGVINYRFDFFNK